MSNRCRLPQEIYDHIVDLLHDDPDALKQCCFVSKSWVPRTRKHLFSHLKFQPIDYYRWKKTFLEITNSPACYTRTLTVGGTLGDVDEGASSWVRSFSRVQRLIVECGWIIPDTTFFLSQYCELAPSLKSLHVNAAFFPAAQTFDLVRFLPLLEDLVFRGRHISSELDIQPATTPSPALTGIFELFMLGGMKYMLRPLLDLPGGPHFRKITLACCRASDLTSVTELVAACSDALEYLDVTCEIYEGQGQDCSIDLSEVTKLKDVVFRCRSLCPEWVIKTLETITSGHKDLQQISIYVPYIRTMSYDSSVVEYVQTTNLGALWSDLDRLLVRFWESRSLHSKVVCSRTSSGIRGAMGWARFFVPELTKRGIFDIDNESNEP